MKTTFKPKMAPQQCKSKPKPIKNVLYFTPYSAPIGGAKEDMFLIITIINKVVVDKGLVINITYFIIGIR